MKKTGKKRRWMWALVLAGALALAGCGEEAPETEASSPEAAQTTASAEETEEGSQGATLPETSEPERETGASTEAETEAEAPSDDAAGSSGDLASYVDTWWSDSRGCCLTVESIEGDQVVFTWNVSNRFDRTAEVGETIGTLEGNRVSFTFQDSWNNRGTGALILEDGTITIHTEVTEAESGARWSAACDDVLQREDPANWEYIFPDSDSRYLTREEVEELSTEELRLARNEIFARLGRRFTDPELNTYFREKYWYMGTIDAEDFDSNLDSLLNEYEAANAALIAEVEAER